MSVLSVELRQWLRPGLLGVVAAVDADARPQLARHWGVRLLPENDVLEFYLTKVAGERCLRVFATGARAALNLIEVPSYRSRMFKGRCTVSHAAIDTAFFAESMAATNRAVHGVGMPLDTCERIMGNVGPEHLVALRLVVDSVFDQTPKPGAGAPL
jgi:hypothetical protein